MRSGLILSFLILSLTSFSQIEVIKEKLAFSELVEWKGVLVIAEDDKKKVDFKELTLINPSGEIQWRKLIYPKTSTSYLIHSASSDYIYFIDDLKPVNNAIRYNQVNQSGSITPTKLDLLQIIRKYGYRTPDDIVIENIVNTPKALVFHLSLEVSDNDIIENFFVTITHHNNRVYHAKGPESRPEQMKEEREGPIMYAGCDEQGIYFARYTYQANNHRINFIPINQRAELLNSYSYSVPDFNPILSEQRFFSNEARRITNELEKSSRVVRGVPVYSEGSFYYLVNDKETGSTVVYGADKSGEINKLYVADQNAPESRKYDAFLGVCRSAKTCLLIGSIDGNTDPIVISGDLFSSPEVNVGNIRNNPSSIKYNEITNDFVVQFGSEWYQINESEISNKDKLVFQKK